MAPALPAAAQDFETSSTIRADIKFHDLPVIDLEGLDGDRRPVIVQQIQEACEQWGIFLAINYGLPASLRSRMIQLCKEFFDLPVDEKRKFSSPSESPQPGLLQGYSCKDYNLGRSFLDYGEQIRLVTAPASGRDYNLWPTYPPSFRETEEEYIVEMEKFINRMMEAISESLGLHREALAEMFEEKYVRSQVVNHYPPCADATRTTGLHAHSDFSIVSALVQNEAGLEVATRDGEWGMVRPLPGAVVVNLGDMTQIASNGRYQSPLHRATLTPADRVCVVSHTIPVNDANLAPLQALLSPSNPAKYNAMTFGAYKAKFDALQKGEKNKNSILQPASAAAIAQA